MLVKTIMNQMEEINKAKEDMVKTNLEILKMSMEVSESQLKDIDEKLETETDETKIKELKEKRKKVNDEINDLIKQISAENLEIKEIASDVPIMDNKYDNVYDLLEDLKNLIDQYSNDETSDKEKEAKYKSAKELITSTITFDRLKADSKYNLTKKYLKENYNKSSKTLQNKLANDGKYVYASCFQIKSNISKIIKSVKPDYTEKEIANLSKIYTSYILHHLNRIDLNKEGIYVFYMLNNIYNIENLPIDRHLEFEKALIDALESIF